MSEAGAGAMIRFPCPHCGEPVEVDEAFAGRKGRCPDCSAVVTIPETSPPETDRPGHPRGGGSASEDAPPPADPHAPRRMTLPASVREVRACVPEPNQSGVAPALAGSALALAFVPMLSIAGLILGGVARSQLAGDCDQARSRRLRRMAGTAMIVGGSVTVLTVVGAVLLWTAAAIEANCLEMRHWCEANLTALHTELSSWASMHGRYPPRLSDLSSVGSPMMHMGRYHYLTRDCPASEYFYGYVSDLTPAPGSSEIVVYDAVPAHGFQTPLAREPEGRCVLRQNGTVDFLDEATFQREMAAQGTVPARPTARAHPRSMQP